MNSDKAAVFSQAWATNGPELVERLKHNIFTPKKVRVNVKAISRHLYALCLIILHMSIIKTNLSSY